MKVTPIQLFVSEKIGTVSGEIIEADKPSIECAEHLKDVKVPMLFMQGTRDELAEWSLLESVTYSLPQAMLRKMEGVNHAFKASKQNLIPQLASLTKDWICETLIKS